VEDIGKAIYSPGLKRATEENDFKQIPQRRNGDISKDRLFKKTVSL
jgi:hypothetical protein